MAQAIITAPVGFGTAAGTGGPLLWNGSGGTNAAGVNLAGVNAVILGVSYAITTAETTTNIALGLTGGAGQSAAPTSTTVIDGLTCARINAGNVSANGFGNQCSVYRVGTVSTAGKWFFPLASLSTATITTIIPTENYVDLAGMFVVPPGSWISVAGSATGTAAVLQIGLVWAEIPSL